MLKHACVGIMLIGVSAMASAQLALPNAGGLTDRLGRTIGTLTQPVGDLAHDATTLVTARIDRLGQFLRTNRAVVEADDTGQPARAREILLLDPDKAALERAAASGYRLIEQGQIEGLDVPFARLATPPDAGLSGAIRQLRRLLPGKQISADQIHFASGKVVPGGTSTPNPMPRGGTVGVIDGGVLPGARIAAQAGFAGGAPRPNAHAQAIASLLGGAGTRQVYVADVYGADPAGGNALAIARALGWLVGKHVPVASISLIGPANPLLERAIAAAQQQGMIVTAAVGNDGPAAPPAYPASYAGVIAVTGVDGHGRPLFEAGRATHLDYAAPGADMTAIGLDGRVQHLRGTSFAAPLVAARLAALGEGSPRAILLARADAEAVHGGKNTGRGILCPACRSGN